jgi:hypothetical protein
MNFSQFLKLSIDSKKTHLSSSEFLQKDYTYLCERDSLKRFFTFGFFPKNLPLGPVS